MDKNGGKCRNSILQYWFHEINIKYWRQINKSGDGGLLIRHEKF